MADDSSETSDESLDAGSEKFDPLKALYSSKVRLASSVPIYDNVSKFESILKGTNIAKKVVANQKWQKPRGRDFYRIKIPVQFIYNLTNATKVDATVAVVHTNISRAWNLTSAKVDVNCSRVIYTRNARGIRGHVEAYVAAFDKHWNLALEDCYEIWTRKVKRKAPALGADAVKVEAAGNDVPKAVVRKNEGKTETLERHVPQMLLRGEQVAIIIKIN